MPHEPQPYYIIFLHFIGNFDAFALRKKIRIFAIKFFYHDEIFFVQDREAQAV